MPHHFPFNAGRATVGRIGCVASPPTLAMPRPVTSVEARPVMLVKMTLLAMDCPHESAETKNDRKPEQCYRRWMAWG